MDNAKNNEYYIRKILKDISFIMEITKDITLEDLEFNEMLCDSVLFRLIQISENSLRLTEDFKVRYSNIPWRAIKGMRNKIVHEYGEVDFHIVFRTITEDIPELYGMLNSTI